MNSVSPRTRTTPTTATSTSARNFFPAKKLVAQAKAKARMRCHGYWGTWRGTRRYPNIALSGWQNRSFASWLMCLFLSPSAPEALINEHAGEIAVLFSVSFWTCQNRLFPIRRASQEVFHLDQSRHRGECEPIASRACWVFRWRHTLGRGWSGQWGQEVHPGEAQLPAKTEKSVNFERHPYNGFCQSFLGKWQSALHCKKKTPSWMSFQKFKKKANCIISSHKQGKRSGRLVPNSCTMFRLAFRQNSQTFDLFKLKFFKLKPESKSIGKWSLKEGRRSGLDAENAWILKEWREGQLDENLWR